jgi:release factor H-coupled RctB family protein
LHQAQYPNAQQLLQTDLGGVVVCEKKDLVFEEAPTSYKDIDNVIKCLTNDVHGKSRGLVRILATLRPILTYKYKDPYNR